MNLYGMGGGGGGGGGPVGTGVTATGGAVGLGAGGGALGLNRNRSRSAAPGLGRSASSASSRTSGASVLAGCCAARRAGTAGAADPFDVGGGTADVVVHARYPATARTTSSAASRICWR